MTPSHEIYNRIVWDPRLDRDAFAIGYHDRMAEGGVREALVSEWDPEGDVPWHRIRYFRCGQTVVWDRERQIDLFAADDLPPEAWA